MASRTIEVLKKALSDPRLEIKVLTPSIYESIRLIVTELHEDGCISEWVHKLGEIKYEYHVHNDGTELRTAFESGARGGMPWLVHVYSKSELELLINGITLTEDPLTSDNLAFLEKILRIAEGYNFIEAVQMPPNSINVGIPTNSDAAPLNQPLIGGRIVRQRYLVEDIRRRYQEVRRG